MHNPYKKLNYEKLLADRRILIVGGGAIMENAARRFAEQGAEVICAGREKPALDGRFIPLESAHPYE